MRVYSFTSDSVGCKSFIADPQKAMDFILAALERGGGPITVALEEISEADDAALPDETALHEAWRKERGRR